MTKFNELLADAPISLIKDADVESPDEQQLEQDFADMAFVFLRDRAQALMPHLLGFEVVDREEDGSRAVGIFGFKISDKYYYVPAFFVNKQVKGMDLLYAKSTNSFMPLRETWINQILNKSTLRLGEGATNGRVREDFENPNFGFLAEPPVGIKAGSDTKAAYTDYEVYPTNDGKGHERVYRDGTTSKASRKDKKGLKPGQSRDNDGFVSDASDLDEEEAAINKKAISSIVEGGFQAWNDIQGSVVEGMRKDADFQEAWAGAIAALKGETLTSKQAADTSPIITFLSEHGGPDCVAGLMRNLQDTKYAEAFLSFYPEIKPFMVTEFDSSLRPESTVEAVKVASSIDDDMTDSERLHMVRHGFAIKDAREEDNKSILYDTEFEKRYGNPDRTGMYDILLPSGGTQKSWVIMPAGGDVGRGVVCVHPTKHFCFTAPTSAIFVCGDPDDEKDPYSSAVSLGSIKVDESYVLVSKDGKASSPFRTRAVIAESGARTRIRVSFDSSLDHTNADIKSTAQHANYCCTPNHLQLADHESPVLRESGEDLIVPSDWKALKIVQKYDYIDSKVRNCSHDGYCCSSECECDDKRDKARAEYTAFKPGTMLDLTEAMHKSSIHHLTVDADQNASDVHLILDDCIEGPYGYKTAMVRLVDHYGLSVDDAQSSLKEASINFKSRHLIKFGQLAGVQVDMPQAPGPTSEDISGMGLPMEEPFAQANEGSMLGAAEWQDSTQPGFAVGGQAESDQRNGGGGISELAEQAAASGQKNVFDHATIGGLARMYDASSAIDTYLPELNKSLDRLGRILFIFYWKNEDFAERYGSEDLAEMEDLLRGVFKSYGDLLLKLRQKSVASEDPSDVLTM